MRYRLIEYMALAILTISSACSCEKDIDFSGVYDGAKLVLFSCADPGKTLSAYISKSRFILEADENYTTEVKGARLNGRVGDTEIVFEEDADNPGHFTSSYFPRQGDRIELSASLKGFKDISSSATVPSRPSFSIDNVRFEPAREEYSWSKVYVRMTIHDDPSKADYYKVSVMSEYTVDSDGRKDSYLTVVHPYTKDVAFIDTSADIGLLESAFEGDPDLPSFFDDGVINGKDYTFEFWFEVYDNEYPYWLIGGNYGGADVELPEYEQRYCVELSSVSHDLYRYSKSLEAYNMSDFEFTSMLGEPVSIFNNISGGIGCFGALDTQIEYFEVK